MQQRYDVLIIADLRFPGGTSTAIAAEIEAHTRAGYSTGLIALKAPVLKFPHPIHPAIRGCIDRGLCELVDPATPVSAGLVLLHHPQSFTHLPARPLRVDGEASLLIVHQPPLDAAGGPFYDWGSIDRNVEAFLGTRPLWAPISPRVREQLLGLSEGPRLHASDWHNVLDADAWRLDRRDLAGPVPVIGRHSRPDPLKWPASRDEILQLYPASDEFRVRILGVDQALRRLLAPVPGNWEVLPFGAITPLDFLRSIDFFVYFHHPRWVEAFGRSIAEAMAAGRLVVLPPYFRSLFQEAAVYAEPAEVVPLLHRFRGDEPARVAQCEQAEAYVRQHFSYARHVERVRSLIGPPVGAAPRRRPRAPARRVLLVSSNGVGLGHLTRLLAVARRCPDTIEPVFVSFSAAIRIVEQEGFAAEYLPFHAYLGATSNRWNHFLAQELREIVSFYGPRVLVFDGNTPYSGLISALQAAPALHSVWLRRGLWPPASGGPALAREAAFDAVLEPADLAQAFDRGPTRDHRHRTRQVAPIRLLDEAEILDRRSARQALGLAEGRHWVLLQLGSGNVYDYDLVQQRCLELLGRVPGLEVMVLESPIRAKALDLPAAVRTLRLFPASRYYRAFDFVISAAGYNSYHELLLSGTPTLFIPNEHPMMDEQRIRAEYAEHRGLGLMLRTRDVYRVREKLEVILDPGARQAMRERMERLDRTNGAAAAAAMLEEMAATVRADRAMG